MPDRPVTWARAGDRYPDLKDEPDSFIALDGNIEVGIVKFVAASIDAGSCMWSMLLTHPGLALKTPTNGTTVTPKEAARATLVHGYANPLKMLMLAKLMESPKALKVLPGGRIHATRSHG